MGHRRDPSVIVADGKSRTLTRHAQERVSERKIEISWIVDVLENWVARRWNEEGQSMNYWGFIGGRRPLLLVAVSEDDRYVVTVHFDTGSTGRYHRHRRGETSYFDEVRDAPQG